MGLGYNVRDRELPDIGVESNGESCFAAIRFLSSYPQLGPDCPGPTPITRRRVHRISGRRLPTSTSNTSSPPGQIWNAFPDTRLLGEGVTWVDCGPRIMDIEKSIRLHGGESTPSPEDYHFEVKYNVYNYDDFILLDRYYTANASLVQRRLRPSTSSRHLEKQGRRPEDVCLREHFWRS